MKLPEKDAEEDKSQDLLQEPARILQEEKEKGGDEGLDSRWNQRMKEKLERMKGIRMRDTSITVTSKVGQSGILASRQRRQMMSADERIRMTGSGRIREELTERKGVIEFFTGDVDGLVDICVQSLSATQFSPVRFSLNVTIAQADEQKTERKMEDLQASDVLDTNMVKAQMTRLDRDMQTLNTRIQSLLSNADFNKDQEMAFHDQSIAMNRAATYWPMIQVVVLLVTGFTQANHIVRFMKGHHIGI